MKIDLRQIPAGGTVLQGEENAACLDSDDGAIRAVTPISYRLEAAFDKGELFLDGWIEVGFDLRCDRCLEPFRKTVRIDPYHLAEIIENPGLIDLTDRLRDDILLDLPGYPKCENADSPRECPALALVAPESEFHEFQPTAAPPASKAVWEALDDINPQREPQREPGRGEADDDSTSQPTP